MGDLDHDLAELDPGADQGGPAALMHTLRVCSACGFPWAQGGRGAIQAKGEVRFGSLPTPAGGESRAAPGAARRSE